MPKICVVHSKYCKESSHNLALDLEAENISDVHATSYDLNKYDLVFNYGSSVPLVARKLLNRPEAVKICVNKLSTFKRLQEECRTLKWTKDREKAYQWFQRDGVVVARKRQEGNQGNGYGLCETEEQFQESRGTSFYTRYFWHNREFRVDIFQGKILAMYEKIPNAKNEWEFVFCPMTGIPEDLDRMVKAISRKIKIDFCGLDVIVNEEGEGCLVEVNSGPVLHQETADKLVPLVKEISK